MLGMVGYFPKILVAIPLATGALVALAASCTGNVGDDLGIGGNGGDPGCATDGDCDDGDGCTIDSCVESVCAFDAAADMADCEADGAPGLCLSGVCTAVCSSAEDCDDDEVCTIDSCDASTSLCVHTPLPDQEQLGAELDGDCANLFCIGGATVRDVNDSDLPVDDNPCTDDVCNDGTPSNPFLPEGTSCGGNLVCNAVGVCTGCLIPSDCPTPSNPCMATTCVNSECGLEPGNDGDPCASDGVFCNGQEVCSSGNCVSPGDPCDGPDGDGDCSETCDEAANDCNGNDPKDSPCDDGVWCNGVDECNPQGNCSQHMNPPCPSTSDSDCANGCDEANQNCNGPEPSGSPCSDGVFCNGSDQCNNNGSCSIHAGNPCNGPDGDSNCRESCSESNNNCLANDPNGTDCNGVQDTICCSSGVCTTSSQCIL